MEALWPRYSKKLSKLELIHDYVLSNICILTMLIWEPVQCFFFFVGMCFNPYGGGIHNAESWTFCVSTLLNPCFLKLYVHYMEKAGF